MVKKYGIERIGTYSNFNKYIIKNKLKPQKKEGGNPRYEKEIGEQAQIDWIRAYEGEFETIEELAAILETINQDMNITVNQETDMSPAALFYKEKEYLQPLPDKSVIDEYLTPNRYKVTNESLIKYGNSRYSVDPKLIGEEVTVDNLDNKLYIYYNGKQLWHVLYI